MAELFERIGSHSRIYLNDVQVPSKPAGATVALLQAETSSVRYTLDGSTPTRWNGFVITPGDSIIVPVIGTSTLRLSASSRGVCVQIQWGKYVSQ